MLFTSDTFFPPEYHILNLVQFSFRKNTFYRKKEKAMNLRKRIRKSIAFVYCKWGDYADPMGGYHYIRIERNDLHKLVYELKNFNFNPSNYKAYK